MSQVTQNLPYYGYGVYGETRYNTHVIQIYDNFEVNDTFNPTIIVPDMSNSVIFIYHDVPSITGVTSNYIAPILFAVDRPQIITNNSFSDDKPKLFPHRYDMSKPNFI